jgi:hypothetical protein
MRVERLDCFDNGVLGIELGLEWNHWAESLAN